MATVGGLMAVLKAIQERKTSERRDDRREEQDLMKFFMQLDVAKEGQALEKEKWAYTKEQAEEDKEWRLHERKLSLETDFGTGNVIQDADSGFYRLKTDEEGFSLRYTPEWDLFEMQQEVTDASDMKKLAIETNIKEFYEAKEERRTIRQGILDKYPGIDEAHITPHFDSVIGALDGIFTGDLGSVETEISGLYEDITALRSLESFLNSGEGYFSENADAYVQYNQMLDPHEFINLLDDFKATYPGMPTEGIRNAYQANKPTADTIYNRTHALKKEYEEDMKEDYNIIKGVFATINAGNDSDFDPVAAVSEVYPEMTDEDITQLVDYMIIAQNTTNPSKFLNYLENDPTGKLAPIFSSRFPNLMNGLTQDYEYIKRLDLEYESGISGISEDEFVQNTIEGFQTYINELDFTNPDQALAVAFNEYERVRGLLPDNYDENKVYSILENTDEFKGYNIQNEYGKYLGFDTSESELVLPGEVGAPGTSDNILYFSGFDSGWVGEGSVQNFEISPLYDTSGNTSIFMSNGKPDAKKIYTVLNRVVLDDDEKGRFGVHHGNIPNNIHFSSPYNAGTSIKVRQGFGAEGQSGIPFLKAKSRRPNYTLATALTNKMNENMWTHNEYSEAFYVSLRENLKNQVIADDTRMILAKDYGEFWWDDALLIKHANEMYPDLMPTWVAEASHAGEIAQINYIQDSLDDVGSQEYHNILRAINWVVEQGSHYLDEYVEGTDRKTSHFPNTFSDYPYMHEEYVNEDGMVDYQMYDKIFNSPFRIEP